MGTIGKIFVTFLRGCKKATKRFHFSFVNFLYFAERGERNPEASTAPSSSPRTDVQKGQRWIQHRRTQNQTTCTGQKHATASYYDATWVKVSVDCFESSRIQASESFFRSACSNLLLQSLSLLLSFPRPLFSFLCLLNCLLFRYLFIAFYFYLFSYLSLSPMLADLV